MTPEQPYSHLEQGKDCPVCGLNFVHRHPSMDKPKEWVPGITVTEQPKIETGAWWMNGKYWDFNWADLEAIITEANARRDEEWIEMLEKMRRSAYPYMNGNVCFFCKFRLERCTCPGFNAALDQAIANKPK